MASAGQPLLPTAGYIQNIDASSTKSSPKDEDYTPWPSIYMCGFCAIVQAVQFSIYFSSLWPYLISIDRNMPETMLGFTVAMYSLAQCIGAPTFGFWSNRIEQVRIPLMTGFTFMLAGNFLYLCVQFAPISAVPFVMVAARFITGSGTGNATVLRTYVASASTIKDRSRAISCVTGGIAVGSMFGPGLQLLFTPFGTEGFHIGPFRLNIYTAPAAFSMLMNISGIILIGKFFKEKKMVYETPTSETIGMDLLAIGLCIFTRFSQIFSLTTIETIGSPYTMMMFDFDKEQAVTWNSGVHAASGLIGVFFYAFFITYDFSKFLPERISCVSGICSILVFFIATISYPFLGVQVPARINGSDQGCDFDRFSWCDGLTTSAPWVFYGSYILVFGLSWSFLNIGMTTLFSKIIGPRKQGTLQGFFQMAGSVGRMVSPLLMSFVYTYLGPRMVWWMEIVLVLAVLITWYIFYARMMPFQERQEKTSQKMSST